MVKLPDFRPKTTVEPAPFIESAEFSRGQVFPKVVKAPDGRLVVNYWQEKSGRIMGKFWRPADHPNIKLLPSNAPKKVKALYQADGQLADLRSSSYPNATTEALDAWDMYQENLRLLS